MYGLPNQTLESWEATLQNVLKLEPEHISCYGLKVEEGTPMHRYQEFMNLPDDDAQADMYLRAVEILRNKGFKQYEVSNFCRRNQESKHNLKYWTGGAYLGFGPDASSDFAGKRFSMIRDLRAYVDGILNGGQVIADLQEVPQRERAGEYIMMRLRTSLGIQAEEYEKRYLLPFAPLEQALEKCRQRGHAVKQDDGSWRLTPEGFLISNSIISDLQIIPGGDYCTLFTCTPYGINTHRLLVRGIRIETIKEKPVIYVSNEAFQIEPLIVTPVVAAPMLLALLIHLMIKYREPPKKTQEKKEEKGGTDRGS
jgi:coproporphyrinogen III oxidase-like Fe-S oxidoreductase